ncbi:glycosyltransferase family 2 protein [Terriglobus roseus]|uniref:Glycosyltransferase involved in cell wall bisynthesis n=1 Tax=Terriglobus roseus TaxID=392734 RepID=A0A1H4RVD0_9BACT|nr:glycosyltransferase family 2 protein [Terriglobus roseus]SEC35694.1 Glycosyltransferase involved in cell wall bisynthesis [Terriglobus roseus]
MPEDARPLLTIAIPTYNRAVELKMLLEYLAPQLTNRREVELLIFDNASPDDTQQVVEAYLKAGLQCSYIRRPENVGPDGNFLDCYGQAKGKFVWVFGDDDVIFPGSIERILQVLRVPDVDLVFVPAEGFVARPDERVRPDAEASASLYRSALDFITAVSHVGDLALISAIIVNKDRVEDFPHRDFREGAGSYLIQLGWTFSCVKNLRSAVVFCKGLIATCEKAASRPFDMVEVFGKHWKEQAQRFLGEGTPLYDAVIRRQLDSWFANNWIRLREQGYAMNTADPPGQMRQDYGDRVLYWLMIYPLLVWPLPLARVWKKGIRGVRYFNRRWTNRKATVVPV